MLIILTIGFLVWATPRSMVITLDEARAMGGTHHPLLGFFGVMSAKNTVVNLMILTTFLSYILYRLETNIRAATVRQGRQGLESFSICFSFGRLRRFSARWIAACRPTSPTGQISARPSEAMR